MAGKKHQNKEKAVLKEIFLNKEIKSLKILIVGYAIFILFAIGGLLAGKPQNPPLMEDWEFGVIIMSGFVLIIYTFLTIRYKKFVLLAKYILLGSMAGIVTLGMYWAGSIWIFLGYSLLLASTGFFYDRKLPLGIGLVCLLFFLNLILVTNIFPAEAYAIRLVYLCSMIIIMVFVTHKNHLFTKEIVQKQAETIKSKEYLEEARNILEIKVQARIKELEELLEQREKTIEERTETLQERVKELERFSGLAIGRELKMIELKKEIKRLKESK